MFDSQPTELNSGRTYPECFSSRVRQFGSAVAATFGGQQLSYAELNSRANQLAHHLQSLGVGPEVLVAVCLERSLDLVVALLAVWKAGGAFLPLDPGYPTDRLAFLIRDAKPAVLLTRALECTRFAASECRIVCVETLAQLEQLPSTDPPPRASADTLAYVIYTSGSTGAPKGVEVTHGALLSHNLAIAETFQLGPADRVLQFASLSFDVALEEIFPSWLCGCTVVLRPPDVISSAQDFSRFVTREQISILNLPTAYWHELVSHLAPEQWPASVRLVVIGGEKASTRAYQRWKQLVPPRVKLINAYGPTEATITALIFEADRSRDVLPIGKALRNSYALILDEDLRPVVPGGTGELYLGGAGLARGYLRRPELTAERFIANPLPGTTRSERLYRTGDLARQQADGTVEFAGRVDDQIKVRGFRIEPGEVEAALRDNAEIQDAVVVAQEDKPGHKRLVAYVVPEPQCSPSTTELMTRLHARLPAYMVPSVFITLRALPLTPAGKVDRRALPRPGQDRRLDQSCVPARTSAEADLTGIWQEVLQLRNVGIEDNFFELGGDSLLALQVLARIRERFEVELSLSAFFAEPTVAAVAAAIESASPDGEAAAGSGSPLETPARGGKPPASLLQQQLFYLHELNPRSDAYHMVSALRLRGPLEVAMMEQALNRVIARHEALRTCFEFAEGDLCQRIVPLLRLPLTVISLAQVRRRDRQAELQRRLRLETHRPFDLGKVPLLRCVLFRFSETDHVLAVVMHHSISDGWSLGVFFRDVQQAYVQLTSADTASAVPELPAQYRDFAQWQRNLARGSFLEKEHRYWRQALAGTTGAVSWPDSARPKREPIQGGLPAERRTITLSADAVASAGKILRRRRATPFMALLGALALSLYKWTGQTDMVIGTVVAGRNRREYEGLIGCFMNFLPLRVRFDPDESAAELLDHIRQMVFEAQSHQDCPFDQIVTAVNRAPGGARNPLFNVALLWHNYPGAKLSLPGVSAEPVPLPARDPLLDLRFEAEPIGGEWSVACEYDTALFSTAAIAPLLKTFARAFHTLIDEPQMALNEFSAVEPEPNRWTLRSWFSRPRWSRSQVPSLG